MMQMLRKHLHLSVVLFDQLRCYLTHRIGVVRSPQPGSGQNAP